MAVSEFSQFYPDFMAIAQGITEDCKAACGWVAANMVYMDRAWLEPPAQNCIVIVPLGIPMSGNEDGDAPIPCVLQRFGFRIFLKKKITDGMNVIEDKVSSLNALTAVLMASNRYKGDYEVPFVSEIDLEEEKPNTEYWIGSLDFRCQGVVYRHATPPGA